ncbi:HNH endonuclease [Streptomyces sp. NPDC042319]|uniref:HNH endonuclease n=1 Tax=Streptomyces sp. NPDC042319 TaxID=3154332 RepID=UPI0033FEAB9C
MPRTQRSLTDEQALRALYAIACGQVTKAAAAEQLGVSQGVIDSLFAGRSYRHLPRPFCRPLAPPGTYRGTPEAPERRLFREAEFWALVDRSSGVEKCWPYRGRRNADGYGQYWAGRALIGVVSAHRVAYLLAHGMAQNLSRKVMVRHLCAVRHCCNPAHLVLGTQKENMHDRFRLHRDQRGPHPVATPAQPPSGGWQIPVGDLASLERVALEAEFWRKVDASGGEEACWPWTGASRHEFGYGAVYWEGVHTQAGRVSYALHHELALADISAGLKLRHVCPNGSNPQCCNPRHLRLGTQEQNMRDRMAEGGYARADEHFSTKVRDADVRRMREEYWIAPPGSRPTLVSLGRRYGVYWGTVHRLVHGRSRPEAGGPTGMLMPETTGRTNHVRGEAHRMVKVADAQVRVLREDYWELPHDQRPSTIALAAEFGTDSKTVWNWLHGKSRLAAGGPVSEPSAAP